MTFFVLFPSLMDELRQYGISHYVGPKPHSIPKDPPDIVSQRVNFPPLLTRLCQDLRKWSPLFLVVLVEIILKNILLGLLYLLQTPYN